MASCNFCVSYGQKKKLLTVSSSGPEELLQNLKPKIESKFSLGNQAYTMKLKLEQFQTYVDIDEDDMDDVKLLQNGGSIILEQIITNMEPSLQSPQRSPATVDATPSAPADGQVLHLQCSTSSDVSTSSSDKDARGPAQSPSLKVKGFDVREMVKKHHRGPLIEAEYATNQTITTETRHLLTTIVAAEMVKIYSYYPTREEKITVAKSIITAYPSLRSTSSRYPYDIWYDETDSSRGYLSTKLNTMRRSLPQELQQRPRTGKYAGLVKAPKKEELKRTYQQLEVVTSEEEAELVHFCKRASVDSRDEVLEGMRKTFQNRRNWIAETMPSVIQILERYPRFQDTPTVVQQEFKLLLPEATAKLISKWETRFMQSILHICKMSRLPKIQALMKDLYHPASESGDQYEPSDGEMSLYALLGAVYLLPSNAAKRTSLADAVQYFLVTRPPGTSAESFIREQRKDGKLKRSQPYLLGTGSRRLPTQFFVIIDEEAIPCCGDITSAVDVLYKLHFVFNIEYATELKAFYAFLDHFVYEVGLPKVVIPARAKELMASIKALSNK